MEIYRKALRWLDEGRTVALGTVVGTQGSTSQKPGSKALLDADGNQVGTLGGGLVEADALRRMREVLEHGRAQLYEFRLDEEYGRDAGAICGGVMRLFTHNNVAGNAEAYRAALDASKNRGRGVLVTVVDGAAGDLGRTHWVPDGNGQLGESLACVEDLVKCLKEEKPIVAQGQSGGEVFLEPVIPTPSLLIVGGGHVGQALAHQADLIGFDITVFDDRPEFARPELFPDGATTAHGDLRALVTAFPKDVDTYIVIVSKGHKPDAEALEGCIHSRPAYLGLIGSERKVRLLRRHFLEEGLATKEEFDRVVAPIGYEIGAVTVPEIAVSIAAQLVAARRRPAAVRHVAPKIL